MITFSHLGWYGQLGNQLFQYATLRAVAESQGYELRIPMRLDAPKKKGLVELGPLSLACEPLTMEDARQIKYRYKERGFGFDPNIFDLPDWTDLIGFFQSEKYFKQVRRELLREFAFRDPIAAYASRYVQMVRLRAEGAALVAVHVRRGDYLGDSDRFRVLTESWYCSAMDMFASYKPIFLFFSDDLEWCKENFSGVTDPNSVRPAPSNLHVATPSHWHDLAVMTQCDHFIVAGSSFSWWGAWLSQNEKKIVVAPKPWYGPEMRLDESDIVPEDWRQL